VTLAKAVAANDVGHECVARHHVASRQGDRQRVQVQGIAGPAATLGQLMFDGPDHPPARIPRGAIGLRWQPPPTGEAAQQLEQLQIRPRPRLELVGRGFDHGDRMPIDRLAQQGLELTERGFALRDSAQIVLI
jgi:hypothetical protein